MSSMFKVTFLVASVLIVATAVYQSVDALTQSHIKQEQSSVIAKERNIAYYAM